MAVAALFVSRTNMSRPSYRVTRVSFDCPDVGPEDKIIKTVYNRIPHILPVGSVFCAVFWRPPAGGRESVFSRLLADGGERVFWRPPADGGEGVFSRPLVDSGESVSCELSVCFKDEATWRDWMCYAFGIEDKEQTDLMDILGTFWLERCGNMMRVGSGIEGELNIGWAKDSLNDNVVSRGETAEEFFDHSTNTWYRGEARLKAFVIEIELYQDLLSGPSFGGTKFLSVAWSVYRYRAGLS